MEYESTPTYFTHAVDFLWDHKLRFLLVMAAIFFLVNGYLAAYNSFDPAQITSATVDSEATIAPTTTPIVVTTQHATSSTPISTEVLPKKVSTPTSSSQTKNPIQTQTQTVVGRLPSRIVINKIGVDIAVANPKSTDDAVLNSILLSEVVRYAGSGTLDSGNMLIMGHSSELPVIHNPLYKVFTKLKYLQPGDEITIYSGTQIQTYKVTHVRKVNTHATDAYVSFQSATPQLTLLTCNVLAEKSDRYLVEADRI